MKNTGRLYFRITHLFYHRCSGKNSKIITGP